MEYFSHNLVLYDVTAKIFHRISNARLRRYKIDKAHIGFVSVIIINFKSLLFAVVVFRQREVREKYYLEPTWNLPMESLVSSAKYSEKNCKKYMKSLLIEMSSKYIKAGVLYHFSLISVISANITVKVFSSGPLDACTLVFSYVSVKKKTWCF